MTKPRVFVVQQPTGRDPANGMVRNTMDLTPAAAWGDLSFILPETENPFRDISQTARKVHNHLAMRGYGPDDFLLLVGNPTLIAVVAAVAASQVGRLRLLQWHRTDHSYRPVEVHLPALATSAERG